jgi:hypothetical protein
MPMPLSLTVTVLAFSIDADADFAFFALAAVACHGGHAALLDGIDAIAHQFPQEHLMAGIDGLLDDREDVLGMDLNLTLFEHSPWQRFFSG